MATRQHAQALQHGYVRVFDTTLRDGEQSPGATMTSTEKLVVARALSRLGVDVLEAGFPAASNDDLIAVQSIAESVGCDLVDGRPAAEPPIICGLARASKGDIDRAWQGVKGAKWPRIHTFIATSPIHREHKLRMSTDEVIARVRDMVTHARSLCPDIEFSPEDAGRTEPEFLYQVLEAAIECGATTLNIPDTVGYTLPDEYGKVIAGILANVKRANEVVLSVHCHDDLGLATANTLAGVRAGARQVEVTINGIGERAGNAALEEIVMALHTRQGQLGLRTGIATEQLTRASHLVSTHTGMQVQANKAIVGANAFAHEAGIHQDGMLKHEQTYEIMRPETVGATASRLVLGKHSGRHAVASRLQELGYSLDNEQLDTVAARLKALADKKKTITDADLEALVTAEIRMPEQFFQLEALQVGCGTMNMPTATVRIASRDNRPHTRVAMGAGPVDAVFKAIDEVVQAPVELLEYAVQSITEGIDALGEVTVRIRSDIGRGRFNLDEKNQRTPEFYGHGADTDIMVASAKAYLAAVNRLFSSMPEQERPAQWRDDAHAPEVTDPVGTDAARKWPDDSSSAPTVH